MLTDLPPHLRHRHACAACAYRGSDFGLARVQRDWYACHAHPETESPSIVVRMSGFPGDYLALPLSLADISPMLHIARQLGVFTGGA